MANMGVISALAGRGTAVFEDRLNHASLLDGGLLSGAHFNRYAHADMDSLERSLRASHLPALIVTDGVFSMDGDLAPLPALSKLAERYNTRLLVDDAHGLGVVGPNGGGIVDYYGLSPQQVPVLVGTLGKAFGTFGAFAAGSEALIETLIQKARTYIYTTALPSAIAEATRASLKLVLAESWRRDKLTTLVEYFQRGAGQLDLPLMPSNTPIQPILAGTDQRAQMLSRHLLEAGFLVGAIRSPTVPEGSARLRVTFSAEHETEQVDRLLEALALVFS
jgi:8-amino-7-oxononanoate synthase